MALNTTATASNSSERRRSNSPIRKYFSPKSTNDSPSPLPPSSPKKPLATQNENTKNAILNKTKETQLQQSRFLDCVSTRKSQSISKKASTTKIDEKPKPPTLKRSHSAMSSLDTANASWMNLPVKLKKKTSDSTYDRLTPVITDMPTAQLMINNNSSESRNMRIAQAIGLPQKERILGYSVVPPPIKPDIRKNASQPTLTTHTSARTKRRIPETPEKILDAPYLADDYYLNLLDWSKKNAVAIGLDRAVYIWNADNGSIDALDYAFDDQVTSLGWSDDGTFLTVGTSGGETQLWDITKNVKLRSLKGQDCRIGVLGWDKSTVSSGARDGSIFNHDVRKKDPVAELYGHSAEVCGLKWRRDGILMASGGNDNTVNIWDARRLTKPHLQKREHTGAIKALAWCPWNPNLLATGGGRDDKKIIFWNSFSGVKVKTIETQAQVTSLHWSEHYKEIVSTHGLPHNHITLWGYEEANKIIDIPAHDSRILHSAMSPDGQVLATAAADENLKFWRIFDADGRSRLSEQRGLHTKKRALLSRTGSLR